MCGETLLFAACNEDSTTLMPPKVNDHSGEEGGVYAEILGVRNMPRVKRTVFSA